MPTTTTRHPSFCRICSAACGVDVEVADGRVVAVHGDREHPTSEGYVCVKGRPSADLHNGEDRLFSSRRRTPSGQVKDIDAGVNTNTLTHSAMKAWPEGLSLSLHGSSRRVDEQPD